MSLAKSAAVAAVALSAGASAQCLGGTPSNPLGPGTYNMALTYNNLRYTYILEIPRSYDPANPTPFLTSFHGFTNSAQQQCNAGTQELADELGYVAVCPQGQGLPSQWNGGECCGDTRRDDVGFARALVTAMSDRVCIDENKVYSAGYSNGGYLSYRLACEASDMFSGILNVAGLLSSPNAFPCNPEYAVPVLHVHGTNDLVINYAIAGIGYERYAEDVHECSQQQDVVYTSGPVTCAQKRSCQTGMAAQFCSIQNGSHSNVNNRDISPVRRAFEFFAENPRKPANLTRFE